MDYFVDIYVRVQQYIINIITIGAKNMNHRGFWVPFIALLSGCASSVQVPQRVAVTRTPIEKITDLSLAADYALERSYRRDKEAPLKLGLALSGGGTKAAMFAHGVLNGLYNEGILQRVDAISTVSGGGYAAYWYYSKLLAADQEKFSISNIFNDCLPKYWTENSDRVGHLASAMARAIRNDDPDADPRAFRMPTCQDESHFAPQDPYRWQSHLTRWPDIFGTKPVSPDGSPQSKPEKEIRQGLFNGLFVEPFTLKFAHKESSIPKLYQWGIERTWGLNPVERATPNDNWRYTNALGDAGDTRALPLRVNPAKADWRALRNLYERSSVDPSSPTIPLWIVNANAGGKTSNEKENITRIFEMTPFGSGAEIYGYVNNIDMPPIQDLGTSVRAAAGFADAQGLTSYKRHLLELLSNDILGLRWGVNAQVATTTGEDKSPRLSDGGGGENLGLLSLLRRGVKDIIVVDAAQDVEGDMADLCTVKKSLPSGFKMEFPTLDRFEDVCAGTHAYNLSDWKSPVVFGTVTWPGDGTDVRQSRIWLIKAGWNQNWLRKTYNENKCGNKGYADCFLTVFYGHNSTVKIHGKTDPDLNMVFPQLPTAGTTANSSSYLFWGYRELGRSMARQLVWNKNTEVLELHSAQCYQRAAKKVPNDRPYPLETLRATELCPGPG